MREAAVSSGVAKKSAPENLQRADAQAEERRCLRWPPADWSRLPMLSARRDGPCRPFRPTFPSMSAHVIANPRLRHGASVEDLSYTADGSRLATVSTDGIAKIWDVATGREAGVPSTI